MRPPPAWTFGQSASMSCTHGESGRMPAGAAAAAAGAGAAGAAEAAAAAGAPAAAPPVAFVSAFAAVPASAAAGVCAASSPLMTHVPRPTTMCSFMGSPLAIESVRVSAEQQAVPEVGGPAESLRHGLAGTGPGEKNADSEVRIDLPVRVP